MVAGVKPSTLSTEENFMKDKYPNIIINIFKDADEKDINIEVGDEMDSFMGNLYVVTKVEFNPNNKELAITSELTSLRDEKVCH